MNIIAISADTTNAQHDFGVQELISTLSDQGFETAIIVAASSSIVFSLDGSNEKLWSDGFEIRMDETVSVFHREERATLFIERY